MNKFQLKTCIIIGIITLITLSLVVLYYISEKELENKYLLNKSYCNEDVGCRSSCNYVCSNSNYPIGADCKALVDWECSCVENKCIKNQEKTLKFIDEKPKNETVVEKQLINSSSIVINVEKSYISGEEIKYSILNKNNYTIFITSYELNVCLQIPLYSLYNVNKNEFVKFDNLECLDGSIRDMQPILPNSMKFLDSRYVSNRNKNIESGSYNLHFRVYRDENGRWDENGEKNDWINISSDVFQITDVK